MASDMAKAMQFMLSHGCVSIEELRQFLSSLKPSSNSQLADDAVNRSIENINGKIRMFNMRIRSGFDANTRKQYYALISTVDNEITRKASHYSEKEFEYFRRIWELIQDEPAPLDDILQIGRELKLTSPKNLIEEWIRKYWLHEKGGVVRLGVRSELELDVLKTASRANRPSTSSMASLSASRVTIEEENDDANDDDDDDDDDDDEN